jgi:hypothetical protein
MRLTACILTLAALGAAADKKPLTVQGANDKASLSATLFNDKESITQELGAALESGFIVVRVEVTPKGGPLAVARDDFLLRSYKDGQKSGPFHPSQIAGNAALVISSRGRGGPISTEQGGPVWGPIGTGGRPRRLPGSSSTVGGGGSGADEAQATLSQGADKKEDPLLAALKAKILEEKETREPLSGLLYFSLDGKHKDKDLVLQYDGPGRRLILEFKK